MLFRSGACDSQYGGDGDGGYLISGGGLDQNANYELVGAGYMAGCFRMYLGFTWMAGAKFIGACDKIWMDSGSGILLTYRVGGGWLYDLGSYGVFVLNDTDLGMSGEGIGAWIVMTYMA